MIERLKQCQQTDNFYMQMKYLFQIVLLKKGQGFVERSMELT